MTVAAAVAAVWSACCIARGLMRCSTVCTFPSSINLAVGAALNTGYCPPSVCNATAQKDTRMRLCKQQNVAGNARVIIACTCTRVQTETCILRSEYMKVVTAKAMEGKGNNLVKKGKNNKLHKFEL